MTALSRVAAIAELQRAVQPGLCCFCEEPIPASRTKPGIHCGGLDCISSYHRLYREHRTRKMHSRGLKADGGTWRGRWPSQPRPPAAEGCS